MDIPKKRKRENSENPPQKPNRNWTLSIVVPDSILYNSQSLELQTYLVSQIARAASIYNVEEIIILNDAHTARTSSAKLDAANFFIRNLEYMETPQYLRKSLFPMHPDLRFSGLMNPLDTPHHLRINEDFPYREGVVVDRPIKNSKGSWVNIGLKSDAIIDYKLNPGTRVTIKLTNKDPRSNYQLELAGDVVSPSEPKIELGVYWGYQVRLCKDIESIHTKCPYEGGYDLKIGISGGGHTIDSVGSIPKFNHAILMFGGLAGLEDIFEADETIQGDDVEHHFDYYLNTCPGPGTRSIRSEEAVLISLTVLAPILRRINS